MGRTITQQVNTNLDDSLHGLQAFLGVASFELVFEVLLIFGTGLEHVKGREGGTAAQGEIGGDEARHVGQSASPPLHLRPPLRSPGKITPASYSIVTHSSDHPSRSMYTTPLGSTIELAHYSPAAALTSRVALKGKARGENLEGLSTNDISSRRY